MPITQTVEELMKECEVTQLIRKDAEQALSVLAADKAGIEQRIEQRTSELKKARNKLWLLAQLMLLAPIPTVIANLLVRRSALLEKRAQLDRRDITLEQLDALKLEVASVTTELQHACPHPLVLSYDGSDEYEDVSYPSLRVCAVCGLEEKSAKIDKLIFSALLGDDTRLIYRDWGGRANDEHRRRSVLVPFDEVYEACIAATNQGKHDGGITWTPSGYGRRE